MDAARPDLSLASWLFGTPTPKGFGRDRIAVTLSVVSRGLECLSGSRLHEVDERRIGPDAIAQGAADGLELGRAQASQVRRRLRHLLLDVAIRVDLTGAQSIE